MSKVKHPGMLGCSIVCCIAWLSAACDGTNTGGNYGSFAGNATTWGSGGSNTGVSASGGSTTGIGGSSMSVEAACTAICANLVAKQCSAETDYTLDACTTDCEDTQVTTAACPDEFMIWLRCNAAQPASSWICNGSGNAALTSGLCAAETSSLTTCLSNG